MSELLPIADRARAREQAQPRAPPSARADRCLGLHAAAAAAGLAGPPMLGRLVESVHNGTTKAHVDKLVLVLAVFLVVQTDVTWFARRASFVLSEKMFAELREDFMHRVLALPLSTVERAGTGDLISRTTADVDAMTRTIRFARARDADRGGHSVLTVVRRGLGEPARRAAVHRRRAGALRRHPLVPEARARRLPLGARRIRTLAGTVGETVEGGRTVEALGLNEERVRRVDADLDEAYRAERRTLFLRTIWFPTAEFAYVLPVAAALAWGGWLVSQRPRDARRGDRGRALRRAARRPGRPADLVARRDPGRHDVVRADRRHRSRPVRPHGDRRDARRRAPGRGGRALRVRRGPRRAARDRPRPRARRARRRRRPVGRRQVDARAAARRDPPARIGRVEVGGVRLVDLPLDTLRKEVALVTQEQHVFVGTVDENLRLARPDATDDQLATRSQRSTRSNGWRRCPTGATRSSARAAIR